MTKYICWGPDKEDLTEQVKARVEDYRVSLVKPVDLSSGKPRCLRIIAVCSQEHKNIFEVWVRSTSPTPGDVRAEVVRPDE